jgi:glucosylceramidase
MPRRVTIDPATGAITRNVEYYVLGHASRFVLPGAYRVAATGAVRTSKRLRSSIPTGAASRSSIATSGEGPVTIALDGERYSLPLPAGAVATLALERAKRPP